MLFKVLLTTVQPVTIAAPGSQVVAVLLAGLLMAFSFQLILANIQVIGGLIALRSQLTPKSAASAPTTPHTGTAPPNWDAEDDSEASSNTADSISFIAGLSLMGNLMLAIAPASFLAVKLSRIDQPFLGAILGLVLWSAYFLLLTWLSSWALGSILQTLLGGALDALSQLLGAIGRLFRREPTMTEDAVKQEIQSALASFDLDSRMQSYLAALPPIQFDLKPVQDMLLPMLTMPAFQSLAGRQLLDTVDRDQLGQLLRKHTQFSDAEVNQMLDQLQPLWNAVRSQTPQQNPAAELVRLLKEMPITPVPKTGTPASPAAAVSKPLSVGESAVESGATGPKPDTASMVDDASSHLSMGEGVDFASILLNLLEMVDADSVLGELLNQVDLSEWDVARLWQQFQQLQQHWIGKAAAPLEILPEDIENYLRSAAAWELNSDVLAEDIPDLFYDPAADPAAIQRQLNQLNLENFTQVLNQRGDLPEKQVESLATQLENLRQMAMAQSNAALETARLEQLGQVFIGEIAALPPSAVTPEQLTERLEAVLKPIAPETILALHKQVNVPSLTDWLKAQTDLGPDVIPIAATALDDYIHTHAAQIVANQAETQAAMDEIQTKLRAYLTYTPLDKVTNAGIRHKLQALVEDAPADLYQALPHLEVAQLHEILAHRQGLELDQRDQIVVQIQTVWSELVPAPQAAVLPKSFVQRLSTTLAEIARSQNVEQLTLEDLKPHLLELIRDPDMAFDTLAQELAQVDWSPLLRLLQEIDFDASQIPDLLQWLQSQLYAAARLPRRWLTRMRDQEQRFEKRIQRYLKYRAKADLQPEKMRRDLQKMLQIEIKRVRVKHPAEPKMNAAIVGNLPQLPQLPESATIATVLADRQDMTPSEIEQISQVLHTTWQDLIEQFLAAQQAAQASLESLWDQLTTVLSSIQLPTIVRDQIEQGIDRLLDPLKTSAAQLSESFSLWLPDSPLAFLRRRLDTWNPDAIVQLVQTRDDISLAVTTYAQTRLEQIRSEIDQELTALEQAALKQLNEIRRAAATAATWLLGIVLVSAASAALAGFFAVHSLS